MIYICFVRTTRRECFAPCLYPVVFLVVLCSLFVCVCVTPPSPLPTIIQQTRGFSTFGVSPDGQRLCLMQQDMTTGFYTISVLEGGEGALDPLSTATMEQVSEDCFFVGAVEL